MAVGKRVGLTHTLTTHHLLCAALSNICSLSTTLLCSAVLSTSQCCHLPRPVLSCPVLLYACGVSGDG